MSRVIYATTHAGQHWSADTPIFTITREASGAQAQRQIANFGASWAAAVLGPDLIMPGQQGVNAPTAVGAPWNQLLMGGPPLCFIQDVNNIWVRGHLINGRWGGAGNTWQNLTPLTAIANPNHATVEAYIDSFLISAHNYEDAAHRNDWYGVYYCVQCSAAPFSDPMTTNNGNLYSYAPAFIKISWRAVSIPKPVNTQAVTAANNIGTYAVNAVPALPMGFVVPPVPGVMVGAQTLPAPNVAGGAVLGALPGAFPAAQANGFDGTIEIHQS